MPNIDLSILNQRQTPAFFADTLANRPAAGFLGRIFVSTDTFAFYRDNGTGWDLIGGPGTGTITGSGANGQIALWNGTSTIVGDSGLTYDGTANSLTASKFIVTGGTSTQFLKGDGTLDSNTYNTGSGAASQVAFFSGTNAITGENNLWWDSTNNHFGINTNTPGTALDIHHDQSTLVQLNQTTATNDTRLAFQNNGTALWRIGNFYNAGANDWGIFDVVGSAQQFSIKKTTGQTFIGAQTTTSGRLVVNNATGDNHIVVIGATAPSLRINNSGTGATKQIGIGLATTTNNFIQGAADRDMAIFNSSTTASPILFGIYDAGTSNTQEAARISAARNFLIGTTTDGGQKLQVNGSAKATGYYLDGMTAGSGALYYSAASNRVTLANYNASGQLTFEINGGTTAASLTSGGNLLINTASDISGVGKLVLYYDSSSNFGIIMNNTYTATNNNGYFNRYYNNGTEIGTLFANNAAGSLFTIEGKDGLIFRTGGAGGTGTERMRITSSGNIGINTTSPSVKLQVISDLNSDVAIFSGSNVNRGLKISTAAGVNNDDIAILNAQTSTGTLAFQTASTERARITSSGNVLIGTTTDAGQKLQVNGSIVALGNAGTNALLSREISSNTTYGFFNSSLGTLVLTNSGVANVGSFDMTTGIYTPTSDRNKKKNFEASNLGLDAVLKLKPTLYNMISQSDNEEKELGFIAQEVKEVIKEAYVENGEFIGLNYNPIVATLVKAIQELNTKIENLK